MEQAPLDSRELYEREIKPQLEALERQRHGARTWAVLVTLGMIAGTIFVIIKFPAILKTKKIGKLIYSLIVALCAIPFVLFRGRRKRMLIPLVLKLCDRSDLTYTTKACLDRRQMRALLADRNPTSAGGEDGLTGVRHGLRFWFNEANAVKVRLFRKEPERVFRGWLLCLDPPRSDIPKVRVSYTVHPQSGLGDVRVEEGTPELAERWMPPALLDHAVTLTKLAGAQEGRAVYDGGRFVLIIETGRDLFESIANPDEKLTQEAFSRLVLELDTLTRAVGGLASTLVTLPQLQPQTVLPSPSFAPLP